MGRRKIEIQPITHERNRSVTFLKRKNGLFKKAYELGVLCSVDVAVIVFEGRPGHHVKLFQYCSTDVQSLIQRHIRHDGERDTRGPADFVPGAATKVEDVDVDIGDDDDGDEKEVGDLLSSRGTSKRRSDGLQLDPDYLPPRSMSSSHSYPPNPAASMIQRQQSLSHRPSHTQQRHYDNHRSLHLTTDRQQLNPHSSQSKRPRIEMDSSASASGMGVYNNPSQFRMPSHPASLSSQSTHEHGHGSPIHSTPTQTSYHQDYPQFSTPTSATQQQHFGTLQVPPSRDRASSIGERSQSGGGMPSGLRTIYGNVGASTSSSRSDARGPDPFGFLDGTVGGADHDRRRSSSASAGGSGSTLVGLDWPSSSKPSPLSSTLPAERDRRGDAGAERDRGTERPGSSSSGTGVNHATANAPGAGGADWLDFLSGNNGTSGVGTLPSSTTPGGMSWERGASSARPRIGSGGGSGSTGEIDDMSLFGLETKKESG